MAQVEWNNTGRAQIQIYKSESVQEVSKGCTWQTTSRSPRNASAWLLKSPETKKHVMFSAAIDFLASWSALREHWSPLRGLLRQ